MKILGQEVDPYKLFLILVLLLAASGFFAPEEDDDSRQGDSIPSFFEFIRGTKPETTGRRKVKKKARPWAGRVKILPMGAK